MICSRLVQGKQVGEPLLNISLQINAGIIKTLATGIAQSAPKAFVLVISNPVNSTVPIVAEVFKKYDTFDPKRLAHLSPP